jgi:hypothetical protein
MDEDSPPVWVCTRPSFIFNRYLNPGDHVRSAKCPNPNFRPFDPERDKPTVRTVLAPTNND